MLNFLFYDWGKSLDKGVSIVNILIVNLLNMASDTLKFNDFSHIYKIGNK